MLAEAANGAAAEWDAEHHRERLGQEAGAAGRIGPRQSSSSTGLDALGKSLQTDFPTLGSDPPAAWPEQEQERPDNQEQGMAPEQRQQLLQQPAGSGSPGQHEQGTWAVSSPPSSCSLPHHLAALIPSPPKVSNRKQSVLQSKSHVSPVLCACQRASVLTL